MAHATLLLAPTLLDAQRHALARAAVQADAIFLLPDSASKERLRAIPDRPATPLLTIYQLARQLLQAEEALPGDIAAATERRLLLHLLGEMEREQQLSSFAPVRQMPGFIETLRGWLREMKAQGIATDAVAEAASRSASARDQQLAELYRRYQQFLQAEGLVDEEGLLWLAAERLERESVAALPPLIALGFDQFSPVQQRLLAAWPSEVAIYLLWDATRLEGSLALTRLRTTRDALRDRFGARLAVERVSAGGSVQPPPLAHLVAWLFEDDPATAPPDPMGAIRAVAAPSREAEARHCLREAKRLLLAGRAPGDIALLAPDPTLYAGIVHAVAEEYALPVALSRPLRLNPAISALAALVNLWPDFSWRATVELLHSPYLSQSWLDQEQIGQLERLTRERPIVKGRAAWWHALEPIHPGAFLKSEDEERLPLAARMTPDALEAINEGLRAIFDLATPPPRATVPGFARWIQQALLGLGVGEEEPSFRLAEVAQAGAFARRDLQALQHFLEGLAELVRAASQVPPQGMQPWLAFRAELMALLAGAHLHDLPMQSAIPLAPLEQARTLDLPFLFVMGLSEGEFPRPPSADPLYAPLERLSDGGLPLQRAEPGEEGTVWWQLLGAPRERLTLTRPRLDGSGNPWEPSAYWDEILRLRPALADAIITHAIGAIPPVEEAACEREFLLAVTVAGDRPADGLSALWERVQAGAALQGQRADPGREISPFEGQIVAPDLLDQLATRYSARHRWSPSSLGSYARCAYGFFAQEVLALEALAEPSEGLDALQRGSLLHAALETLFQTIREREIALTPGNEPRLQAILEEQVASLMAHAPTRFGFRPDALWVQEQGELTRILRAVVRYSCDEEGHFRPAHQEMVFGEAHEVMLTEPEGERALYVRGVIDRIDEDGEGRLRIIDYKSGSSTFSETDIREGRALQTVLYALAAEQLLGQPVAESGYLHLPKRETSGRVRPDGPLTGEPLVRDALAAALDHADAIRAGRFPSAPKSAPGCHARCDFLPLCRVTRATIAKGARRREDRSP